LRRNIDSRMATYQASSELTATGLDKNELVRLVVQTIDELGFSASARALESESGVLALSPVMRRLRECVLAGDWSNVDSVFAAAGDSFARDNDLKAARFAVYEQEYYELVESGKLSEALICLRGRLAQSSVEPEALHKLPLLCMCSTPEEVRRRARWDGTGRKSRMAVLRKLQQFIPARHLLAENRLEGLLQQALDSQKRKTMYPYTKQRCVSLLEDLEHSPDRVPRQPLFRLQGHTDEVWFVQFSHNGQYLASASKDTSVIVWDWAGLKAGVVDEKTAVRCRLKGHSHVICLISWSPDDTHLLSCAKDRSVRLWNVTTGECIRVYNSHQDQVTCCAWMPDGRSFVSGAMDRQVLQWDAWSGSTEPIGSYSPSTRVNDLTVSADGSRLIVICTDNRIQVFDTGSKAEIATMTESVSITSLALSSDGRHLLVNTSASDEERPEIHIWDLVEERLCQKLRGYRQKRFVIRGCFGGAEQMLVLCGSEDSHVYMWKRHDGNLVARLEGHTATVNSVTFCPNDPDVFASASDDTTVICWGSAVG
jgi:WD repeat-containing protein 26